MRRPIRRNSPEPRLEMTPLLDVVFLLLTFFIFALVLMVRADVLGISLPRFGSGQATSGSATITVALDEHGYVWVDGKVVEMAQVGETVTALREARPEAKVLVAVDTEGRNGALLDLVDHLAGAGIADFSLLGRGGENETSTDTPSDTPNKPGG